MSKFISKEVSFIPEVKKDGYLIGHTGNYLLIKSKCSKEYLNKTYRVKIEKIEYPYCISSNCQESIKIENK